MMGLRKVRSEATSVRKEGVLRNGTEKVSIIHDLNHCYPSQAKLVEEASLTWAIVEMVGLASYCNYFVEGQGAEKPPVKEGVKDGSE